MPIIVSRSSITSGVLAVSRGGTGNTVEVDGAVVSLAEGEASRPDGSGLATPVDSPTVRRSEEHTSELQSLMRISYAVFCLKKKNNNRNTTDIRKFMKNLKTTNNT